LERVNNAIPYPHAFEPLVDDDRFDVLGATFLLTFYKVLKIVDSLAHVSTIFTRSRTVQNVSATPEAMAGVQRIAMLDHSPVIPR
jgi:hypothetical protein